MNSNPLFYIMVIGGSIISLFIPLWFIPFLIAIPVSYYFDMSLKKSMLIHLIVYALICALYCLYAYNSGSKELVGMVGQVFKGLSFGMMIGLSSFLFGITAMLGSWVGHVLKTKG